MAIFFNPGVGSPQLNIPEFPTTDPFAGLSFDPILPAPRQPRSPRSPGGILRPGGNLLEGSSEAETGPTGNPDAVNDNPTAADLGRAGLGLLSVISPAFAPLGIAANLAALGPLATPALVDLQTSLFGFPDVDPANMGVNTGFGAASNEAFGLSEVDNIGSMGLTDEDMAAVEQALDVADQDVASAGFDSEAEGEAGGKGAICTALHKRGINPAAVYQADAAYGLTLPYTATAGYHIWGKPIARQIDRSEWFARVMWWLAKPIIHEMARRGGWDGAGGSIVSRATLDIGVRLCGWLGKARLRNHAVPGQGSGERLGAGRAVP